MISELKPELIPEVPEVPLTLFISPRNIRKSLIICHYEENIGLREDIFSKVVIKPYRHWKFGFDSMGVLPSILYPVLSLEPNAWHALITT